MLKNRCALITGSTGGLGFALASKFAADGASIVLHGLCEAAEGDVAAQRITEATGAEAVFIQADLTSVSEIERLIAAAGERFGGVDILVNNAVVRNTALVEDLRPEQWDLSIAVNLSAAFHTVRLTVPGMKQRGWGRIINMSSVFGARAAEGRIDYITTKTALLGLTRAVAVETAAFGITCNALSPGSVPTPAIMAKLEAKAARRNKPLDEIERDYVSERHPTGRFVAMESVAATASFLCSPAGDDITGATFPVDGGWMAS